MSPSKGPGWDGITGRVLLISWFVISSHVAIISARMANKTVTINFFMSQVWTSHGLFNRRLVQTAPLVRHGNYEDGVQGIL